MTIYILSQAPKECAEMLDDNALYKMIKSIAQVLCNVHYVTKIEKNKIGNISIVQSNDLPIKPKDWDSEWVLWAKKCKANYLYLAGLSQRFLYEYWIRFNRLHKLEQSLGWARDDVPDLPTRCHSCALCYNETAQGCKHCQEKTPLPLSMPEKYKTRAWTMDDDNLGAILSYRNYYKAKLSKKPICFSKWTNRQPPEWIKL